jgi:phospholipid/cholesterol/gamma-HCH transport system substrate-binding protein
MAKRTDEVKVGLFVIVAVVILVLTVFLVGKAQVFGRKSGTYQTKLKFAGGVEQGTVVRFAGIKAGTVSAVQIDPGDNSEILLSLEIKPDTPVKTDWVVSLQTLGLLGDFYVEVTPGGKQSALLPPGSMLQSKEAVLMSQLFDQINDLSKDSKTLIANLNEKLDLLSDQTGSVLTNVNSVLNDSNKRELAALLKNGNTLVNHGTTLLDKETPKVDATLTEVQKAAERITPLLDNVKGSLDRLDSLVKNVDSTVTDLHPDLKTDLVELKKAETQTEALLAQVQEMLRHNRSDIDEVITNLARSSRNVEDLTNTLKQKPYSVIGIRTTKDRKVPGGKK